MSHTDVNLANIERAAAIINPTFLDSPQFVDEQLCAVLGRRTVMKVETVNPIRSFKGRGADFLMRNLDPKQKVICASAGNFGQAIAFCGRDRGIPVEVFTAADVNPMKAQRMRSLGAKVNVGEGNFDTAKQAARSYAQEHGYLFVEDGDKPEITEGAGTIAIELLKAGNLDAIVVPVGDGALICGVGAWVKQHSPATRIVGVCPKESPAMAESWRAGKPITTKSTGTIADGIEVSVPVATSVEQMKKLVDDIVLVDDSQLLDAMRLAVSTLGLILEPSGAAGIAAIRGHSLPGDQIATILTGSNIHPDLVEKIID